MALDADALAMEITLGLGQTTPSDEVKGFAQGIIDELKAATASFGGTPGPHVISGMTGASMAGKIKDAAGYPSVTPQLMGFAQGICDHVQMLGIVTYVGPPPPAVPDWFLGGTVTGLSGAVMAVTVQGAAGFPSVTSQLTGMCSAIADHIVANAEIVMGVIS